MKDETKEFLINLSIFCIVISLVMMFISDIETESPPYPCELTISGKYIKNYDYYFFEHNDYYFEFEENPYFEYGCINLNKSDYYKYEIGDNYSYYWCEEW